MLPLFTMNLLRSFVFAVSCLALIRQLNFMRLILLLITFQIVCYVVDVSTVNVLFERVVLYALPQIAFLGVAVNEEDYSDDRDD